MDDRQLAADQEGKFRFYFVALIFTILGLAVQSAPETASIASRIAELAAWVLLLASGLAALAYLEWSPTVRVGLVRLDEQRELVSKLRTAATNGQQVVPIGNGEVAPIAERIAKNEEIVEKLKANTKKHERRNELRYQVTKWAFVAGIVALGFARGYPLVEQIVGVAKPSESKLIFTTPN